MIRVCCVRLALLLPLIAVAQPPGDYVIGAQDVLTIAVYDQPELGGRFVVELDGTFTFPLIGRIKASDMTIRTFEAEMVRRLAEGFLKNPQVAVSIELYRSQRVFVMGEVRAPGTYPLTGDMTLVEALTRAGSMTQFAADEAIVVRGAAGGQGQPADIDTELQQSGRTILRVNLRDLLSGASAKGQNVVLRDGDTIFVAAADIAYVFGQVKAPGSYPIKTGTTVLQALSLAGGILPTGAANRTRAIRVVNGERQEFRVKLTDLVKPGDTLVVPTRFF